jgi:hypothetical protein
MILNIPPLILVNDAIPAGAVRYWLRIASGEPDNTIYVADSTKRRWIAILTAFGVWPIAETALINEQLAITELTDTTGVSQDRRSKLSKRDSLRKKKRVLDPIVESRFDQFWAAWPHKVSRAMAVRAWLKTKAGKDDRLFQQIMEAVEALTSLWMQDPRLDRYKIHASTWLNQERWLDELVPALPTRATRTHALLGSADRFLQRQQS